MFYVDIQDGKIVSKNMIGISAELTKLQKEITEAQYIAMQLPATFEVNADGEIIDFTVIAIDPEIVAETADEEKVAMAEAIIDLETRLSALEAK